MSIYQYMSGDDRLAIHSAASHKNICFMAISDLEGESSIYIPNADVPTVAAELLKAAGQESVIVPKSKSKVVERPSGQIQCGNVTVYPDVDHASLLSSAAAFIAIAEHVESAAAREAAEKAEAEAAEKKLQERRDALAKELTNLNYAYDDFSAGTYLLKAINRIIELEDGASRD